MASARTRLLMWGAIALLVPRPGMAAAEKKTTDEVYVEADEAQYRRDKKGREIKILIGNVVLRQGPNELHADRVVIRSEPEEHAVCTGNVWITNREDGVTITGGRAEYYKDRSYYKITEDPVMRVTEDNVTVRSVTMERRGDNTAIARGNVVIDNGESQAFGELANYDRAKKRIVLTGDPHLVQGRNHYWADRMVFNTEDSSVHMGPNVRAKIWPGEEEGD